MSDPPCLQCLPPAEVIYHMNAHQLFVQHYRSVQGYRQAYTEDTLKGVCTNKGIKLAPST